MFKIGIYKRRDMNSKSRVLLFKKGHGYIFNSSDYSNGIYGDDWNENFSVIDEEYILSKEEIRAIQKRNHIPDSKIEHFLLTYSIEFNVINEFLVSKNEDVILRINCFDKISKINDKFISIEYSGKKETIKCSEFDKLKNKFMNVGDVF